MANTSVAVWRRTINALEVEGYVSHDGILLVRPGPNRYLVLREGRVESVVHNHSSLGLVRARTLELITGDRVTYPCVVCGKPRVWRSYCDDCATRLAAERRE